MNDEYKSIHKFDVELICRYFVSLKRQGPGNPEVTIKAFSGMKLNYIKSTKNIMGMLSI